MRVRKCIILLCAVVLAASFSGCDRSSSAVIRMDISGPVHNLDPQFTTDPIARMILSNIFEGLMVQSADGSLRPGAAREFVVSADRLVYTFTLREDARWQDGQPVTAQDFVFAFERMFSPQTPSPFAEEFLAISGAGQVMRGEQPVETLGVAAIGQSMIVFTLERPCANFLTRLSDPAALPCNRAAFEQSRGRYGLEMRYVHSNGPFLLDRWDNTRFIQLSRNRYFREEEQALPERVVLHIGRQDALGQFLGGNSDLALVPSERLGEVRGRQAELVPIERTVWGLVFNQNSPPWNNPLLRQSLALTIEQSTYAGLLPRGFTATCVFVPPAMLVQDQSFRSQAPESSPLGFDPVRGRHLVGRALEVLDYDAFPQAALFVPESHSAQMQPIQSIWSFELDADITVEPLEPEQMHELLRTGDYDILLLPFSTTTESPGGLLANFRVGNAFGHNNPRLDHALDLAARAECPEVALSLYKSAEDILLESAAVIPLFFETSYYAVAADLTGLEIFPFQGRILFQNAQRG